MTKYLFLIISEDGTVILSEIKSGHCRVADQCVIMSIRTPVEITNIYYENIETNSYVRGTNVQLKLKNIEEAFIFDLEPINLNSKEKLNNSLVRAPFDNQTGSDVNLIIHYTHKKRLQSNKKDIYQLWNQTFQQTSIMETRLIIDNQNMARELVHRRSHP